MGNGESCFGGEFGNSATPLPPAPPRGMGVILEFIETIDPDRPLCPSSSLSNMNAMIFLARKTLDADNRVVLSLLAQGPTKITSTSRSCDIGMFAEGKRCSMVRCEGRTHPSGISFSPLPGAGSSINVNFTGSFCLLLEVNK